MESHPTQLNPWKLLSNIAFGKENEESEISYNERKEYLKWGLGSEIHLNASWEVQWEFHWMRWGSSTATRAANTTPLRGMVLLPIIKLPKTGNPSYTTCTSRVLPIGYPLPVGFFYASRWLYIHALPPACPSPQRLFFFPFPILPLPPPCFPRGHFRPL